MVMIIDRFIEALERNKNMDSCNLIESFDYRVSQDQGAQALIVSFPLYGRLAEVRSSRLTAGMSEAELKRIRGILEKAKQELL